MMTETPKKVSASAGKAPLQLLPPAALMAEARAFAHGATKYGRWDWRRSDLIGSVYYGAVLRHLAAWYAGEDVDPESGVSHLAHARAGLAIMLDAIDTGRWTDDRPPAA
ncbi:dATP/dGTP diphosphohydrolase domain-containing protein [Niveispirillum sp.]